MAEGRQLHGLGARELPLSGAWLASRWCVRAHLNPALETSLRSGSAVHPTGATAVLELYGKDGALHGWAVGIKTQDDSAGGQGWYWYEVLSAKDGDRTLAADHGVPACVECHVKGRDFVMTSYPLK